MFPSWGVVRVWIEVVVVERSCYMPRYSRSSEVRDWNESLSRDSTTRPWANR
jgi:hypothetical protein